MPRKKAVDQHLHKYEQIGLGRKGYKVFRCTLINCTHYIRKELAEGKPCLCNRCNSPMVLDKRAMQLHKPHCVACIRRKTDNVDKLAELFGGNNATSE